MPIRHKGEKFVLMSTSGKRKNWAWPDEVMIAVIVTAAIEEVNSGSIAPLDVLINKRL